MEVQLAAAKQKGGVRCGTDTRMRHWENKNAGKRKETSSGLVVVVVIPEPRTNDAMSIAGLDSPPLSRSPAAGLGGVLKIRTATLLPLPATAAPCVQWRSSQPCVACVWRHHFLPPTLCPLDFGFQTDEQVALQ